MKRFLRFLVWLVGGIAGTIAIPCVLFGVAALAKDTRFGHYVGILYGASIYFFVPLGFLAAIFMALLSLRRRAEKKEELPAR